jgi:hypothetical protein
VNAKWLALLPLGFKLFAEFACFSCRRMQADMASDGQKLGKGQCPKQAKCLGFRIMRSSQSSGSKRIL